MAFFHGLRNGGAACAPVTVTMDGFSVLDSAVAEALSPIAAIPTAVAATEVARLVLRNSRRLNPSSFFCLSILLIPLLLCITTNRSAAKYVSSPENLSSKGWPVTPLEQLDRYPIKSRKLNH
jgi:hypothetical protein